MAQLAATLGVEFDEEPLHQLAGRPVDDALVRLEDAAIIERVAEVRLGRYRFRHGLLRDATYETQLLPARQQSHRSIAELLASGAASPGDLAVVAQHWDLAGDVARSLPAYIVAAQAAQSAASHSEARQQLDRALELTATMPEDDERALTELMIRTLRAFSTSSQFGYGYPDVFEDFTIAEEICRKLTNRPEIMPAQVGIWSYLLVRGSVDAASVVLEPLTDVLDDPATAWFAPEIKSCMGYSAFYQGRLDEAHRWLVEAWEGYRARSVEAASSPFWPLPHDAVPITAVALACVAGLKGCTEESAVWERRALASAEELDFPSGPFSAAFVSVYLAWIRMVTGNLEEAREFGRRTIEIAERCRFDYFPLLGRQYVLMPEPGQPCDVAELEQYGLGMDLVGHAAFRPTHLGIVAQNHHYLGNADPALRAARRRDGADGDVRRAGPPTRPAPPARRDHVRRLSRPDGRGGEGSGRRRRDRPGPGVPRPRAAGGQRPGPAAPRSADRLERPDPLRGRAIPAQFLEPRIRRGAGSSRGLTWARSSGSVAILGGGMGALATAFELTEGDWTSRFERITVYQRGWRLGGKGASSRGPNGRIEEHGLHVLLGYYDHTFDVMRRCYEALDRERSDPSCPIRTWDDAVAPSNLVGVVDRHDGAWEPWVATFSPVTGRPGGGGERAQRASPLGRGRPRGPVAPPPARLLRVPPVPGSPPGWLHRVQHLADRPFGRRRGARPHRWPPSCRAPA